MTPLQRVELYPATARPTVRLLRTTRPSSRKGLTSLGVGFSHRLTRDFATTASERVQGVGQGWLGTWTRSPAAAVPQNGRVPGGGPG